MSPWIIYALGGYVALFAVASVGIAVLRSKSRNERPPVAFSLLRGPGESLRRQVAKFDEDFVLITGGWALVPIFTTWIVSGLWLKLVKIEQWWHLYLWAGLSIVAFAISVVISMRQVWAKLQRYRSDSLGYLGERYVGECLLPLERDGFMVYHDVPAESGKRKFNLDHVVVGPTGVWLIETKTRRKGRSREGYKDHVVTFDGSQLIWPWGEDRHGLKQAEAECRWLKEWVEKRTGLKVQPKAILTLPGWMVKEQKKAEIRVLNPKNIPSAVRGRGTVVLTAEHIDQIARQLDLVCRDVEE